MSVNIHFCGRKRSVFKERTDTESVNSLGNLFFFSSEPIVRVITTGLEDPTITDTLDNNASMCRVSHHH